MQLALNNKERSMLQPFSLQAITHLQFDVMTIRFNRIPQGNSNNDTKTQMG